ncbi:MAG TPA: 2OG-Fe(II) oxygenase [Candidatus Babeliales bacterium]|jgi:hypothetical protein|nr:2OG-Fe(II) oxygenase [Candidatus Babeliales bacterium]
MNNEILKKISKSLATDNDKLNANFCVEHALELSDIQLNIDGIGALELPLTTQKIQHLIAVSSKAKFGLRNQTILDENVRSTQEIPVDKIQMTFNKDKLYRLLQKARKALGLGEHIELIPHLHNMLIYSPGQFFKKHQDSEKMDGMIATLVVVLPSPHIGGDLIVEHNDQSYTFSSQNIEESTLKCFVFYADCQHEVKKVIQGYRIALTYNLVISSQETIKNIQSNPTLTKYIKDYFSGDEYNTRGDPLKLIYFLDHSYSEHGLRWNFLKGADYKNAQSFYAAAQELELTSHLALVEIHEIWEMCGDEDKKNPDLGDLIDDEIHFSYGVDATNKETNLIHCDLTKEEICWTKETDTFEPYDSEHEGYMGNYGNTMDYWYRRAAVVLWKSDHDIPMQFKLNQERSIQNLVALTHVPGQEQKIIEIIEKAGKYIYGNLRYNNNDKSPLFSLFMHIALYIKDKQRAYNILNQFTLHQLTDDMFVPHIVDLQHIYGINYCIKLLEVWETTTRHSYYNQKFTIENIESLIQRLITAGGNIQLAEYLLSYQIKALIYNDTIIKKERPGIRNKSLQKRIAAIRDVIRAYIVIPTAVVFGELIDHLITNQDLYSEIDLAELYFSFDQEIFTQLLNPYIKALHDFLVITIDQKCQISVPSQNDWSIKTTLPCKCQHCTIVAEFLHASNEKQKIWPLVEQFRKHIIDTMKDLELPIDLSVEKKGSPYKLVMVKNDSLHKDAQEKLDKFKNYQKKLQSASNAASLR